MPSSTPSAARSSMFDTPEDRAVRHVYGLLRDGEWEGVPLSFRQRGLLREIVERRGLARAVPVGRLAELHKASPRDIKSDIRDLRLLFKAPIGSSRSSDGGGYFLITTKQEALDTARPFLEQGKSEFAIARAILEPHGLAEFDGQLQMLQEGGAR